MEIVDQHVWMRTGSNGSGTWVCLVCGRLAFGGVSLTGDYFPGNGERAAFFQCEKPKVGLVEKDGGLVAYRRVK